MAFLQKNGKKIGIGQGDIEKDFAYILTKSGGQTRRLETLASR